MLGARSPWMSNTAPAPLQHQGYRDLDSVSTVRDDVTGSCRGQILSVIFTKHHGFLYAHLTASENLLPVPSTFLL